MMTYVSTSTLIGFARLTQQIPGATGTSLQAVFQVYYPIKTLKNLLIVSWKWQVTEKFIRPCKKMYQEHYPFDDGQLQASK